MGISAHWSVTAAFAFWFLADIPNDRFVPGLDYWIFITSFFVFGVWGLWYLLFRGDNLIR
jgi:hypothetical protein